jgi:hypothetical protein
MTIICCLPSLPVEVFWHLLTPLQRYICAYPTPRDGPPQLAAVSVKSQAMTTLSPVHAFMLARPAFSIQAARSSPRRSQFFIGTHNETLPVAAMRVSNPGYRISVTAGGDRGFSKNNETALRFLLVQALALPWANHLDC